MLHLLPATLSAQRTHNDERTFFARVCIAIFLSSLQEEGFQQSVSVLSEFAT